MKVKAPTYFSKKRLKLNLRKSKFNKPNTSPQSQREAILSHLKTGSKLSTIYAREVMGIASPAARVYELRHWYDYNIHRDWCYEVDAAGTEHRVGCYVLLPGKWKGGSHE